MPPDPQTLRNPPIEYAVAVWVGMPDDEIERGLREGWIRGPQQHVTQAPTTLATLEQAIVGPSAPLEQLPVDRARVLSLLRKLDSSLEGATFDAAWQEAGASEDARAARFGAFLRRALGIAGTADAGADFQALENAASLMTGDARFVRLAGRTGGELESLARGDAGIRAALAGRERWAFTGDRALGARVDPEGRYDRFDRDTGERLVSDHWIHDRARFAAWRVAADGSTRETVEGPGWRFVDRADPAASLVLEGSDGEAIHQVVFARDDGDRVTGGATTDRVHGGVGDDVLIGRGGDDLIEGARGDDVILGGSGRDELAGQGGDDAIDGGGGDDRLDGGSGKDELTGGRGNDRLRGGEGDDAYRFDAGDGRDTIEDDGGELVFDDVAIAGTMRREGDAWTSGDGALRLTLDGLPSEGGTLTIERAEAATDAVRIEGWRPGAWGFTLEAQNGEERAPRTPPPRDAQHTEADGPHLPDGDHGFDLSSLAPDPIAEGTLVDTSALAAALDAWSIPAPPDVGSARTDDQGFVNDAVLTDALASDWSGQGDDAGGLIPLDWNALLQPQAMPDAALAPVRPSPLIRAVTP
jgi:hypothetical protein